MTRLRRPTTAALLLALVLAGLGAVVAGVYLLAGPGVALVVGGALAAVAGLLVDV